MSAFFLVVALARCTPTVINASALDGAAPDTGQSDRAASDIGGPDRAATDAARRDAGIPDLTARDAAALDGPHPDAGGHDDGALDASRVDGASRDVGVDAGAVVVVNTRGMWPLVVGRTWTYWREEASDQRTSIQIVPTESGGKAAWFTKSDQATYWGPGGNLDLEWQLTEGPDCLYANNAGNLDPRAGWDAYPDDRRFSRDGGQLAVEYWYIAGDRDVPAYILYPWDVVVPSEFQGLQYYAFRSGDDAGWMDGNWRVRYSLETITVARPDQSISFQGETLRVRFDESVTLAPGRSGLVHEDWYFADGIGPVRIDRYSNADRGEQQRDLRINLLEVSDHPTLAVSPGRVMRPEQGTEPLTYRFTMVGGEPQRDPGVEAVRNPGGPVSGYLDPLTTDDAWQDNVYVFPWNVSADTVSGTYWYRLLDIHGTPALGRVTIYEPPFSLTVTPDLVVRPLAGQQPQVYRFEVQHGEPDTGRGIRAIYAPGADGNFDSPLNLLTDDVWNGSVFEFHWYIDATSRPGPYVYSATDREGHIALALLWVE